MRGLRLEARRRFNVSSAWGIRRSQPLGGKLGSVALRVEMKWFLKLWIARSAKLVRWSPGEAS